MELKSGRFQHPCFQSLLEGPEGTDYLIHLFPIQQRRLGAQKGKRLGQVAEQETGAILEPWSPGSQLPSPARLQQVLACLDQGPTSLCPRETTGIWSKALSFLRSQVAVSAKCPLFLVCTGGGWFEPPRPGQAQGGPRLLMQSGETYTALSSGHPAGDPSNFSLTDLPVPLSLPPRALSTQGRVSRSRGGQPGMSAAPSCQHNPRTKDPGTDNLLLLFIYFFRKKFLEQNSLSHRNPYLKSLMNYQQIVLLGFCTNFHSF